MDVDFVGMCFVGLDVVGVDVVGFTSIILPALPRSIARVLQRNSNDEIGQQCATVAHCDLLLTMLVRKFF